MLGISQSAMMGIINAQNSIQLAIQNQGLANSTYRYGRIRERQGITDGNQDVIEKGQELQAKGKEMQSDTFGHLGDAMGTLNNIVENCEEHNECEIAERNGDKSPSLYNKNTDGELDIVIGDVVRGSVNRNVPVPSERNINITV